MFDFDFSGSLFSSLLIMIIVAVLFIIAGAKAKKANPTKPSKGLLMLAEWLVEKISSWTARTMGDEWENRYGGYFCCLASYLFLAFIWSLTGLPSVMDYMAMPLSLGLILFILIHSTAVKYQKWGYFHRYIDPMPLFLPINLVSMWSPLISTTFRMFGNALSGYIIIALVSSVLESLSGSIFSFLGEGLSTLWLAPIPVAILNLYFGLFSGYIQTLVFCSLSGIWISQEKPDDPVMGAESQVIRPANN